MATTIPSYPDTETTFPRTYLDRETRSNQNYYFVSYSHRDRSKVFGALTRWYLQGVNYWYDKELDPGDVWNERVERILRHENCRGALVFLSENSLISKAVRREIDIMLDRREKEDGFRLIPIIIGTDDIENLCDKVMNSTSIPNEAKREFFAGYYTKFKKNFEDTLYKTYDDALEEICDVCQRAGVNENLSSNLGNDELRRLTYRNIDGEMTFSFGKYQFDGGKGSKEKDIEWLFVGRSGDKCHFVSKYCIDFKYENEIVSMIENVKSSIETNIDKNRIQIVDLALPNEAFLNRNRDRIKAAIPSDFADGNRKQLLRLFWISENDGHDANKHVLYNSQNVKIDRKFSTDMINAGVRLLLTVKII